MLLRGRNALVTGGTQGVGAAIAIELAKQGANLVLHGLHEDDLARETIARCATWGVQVHALFADLSLSSGSTVADLFQRSQRLNPAIDLLVNNAGVFIDKPFLEMDIETYRKTFLINVESGYFLTQYFAKHWIERKTDGRVLFTGSINGLLAESDHTAYDASKAAVAGMVRSLCVALAPWNIRVNAIAPGLVRTPLTNRVLDNDPATLRWMELHTPNGQVPAADVCGPVASFLLSDAACHIHGQTIFVDGGMSAWQQPEPPKSWGGSIDPQS